MPRRDARPLFRLLLGVGLAATLLPLLGLVEVRLAEQRLAGRATTAQRYYVPPPAVLRGLVFGYNELASDFLWVRAISYFTTHLTGDRDLRNMHRYLTATLALDPHHREIYRYGSAMLTAAAHGNKPILRAIELLRRGHRHFPDDHRMPLRLGIFYMLDLRTKKPAVRRRWRMEGADWLHRAILLGAPQPWLPSLAAQVYTREGEREMAIHRLREIYLVTQNEQMRAHIAKKLRQLKARTLASQLGTAGKRFREARRRDRLGYLSADLFGLIRLPELGPFSLRGQTRSTGPAKR